MNADKGFIYLRKMVDLNGNVQAYCFGKTNNIGRRDSEYKKESADFIKNITYFATDVQTVAENFIIEHTKSMRLSSDPKRKEWVKRECYDQLMSIFEYAKSRFQGSDDKRRTEIERTATQNKKQAVVESFRVNFDKHRLALAAECKENLSRLEPLLAQQCQNKNDHEKRMARESSRFLYFLDKKEFEWELRLIEKGISSLDSQIQSWQQILSLYEDPPGYLFDDWMQHIIKRDADFCEQHDHLSYLVNDMVA